MRLGSITLSCGHKYDDAMGDLESLYIRFKDETCDAIDGFANAVSYSCYCPDCRAMMEPLLIHSDEEEAEWLRSSTPSGE